MNCDSLAWYQEYALSAGLIMREGFWEIVTLALLAWSRSISAILWRHVGPRDSPFGKAGRVGGNKGPERSRGQMI